MYYLHSSGSSQSTKLASYQTSLHQLGRSFFHRPSASCETTLCAPYHVSSALLGRIQSLHPSNRTQGYSNQPTPQALGTPVHIYVSMYLHIYVFSYLMISLSTYLLPDPPGAAGSGIHGYSCRLKFGLAWTPKASWDMALSWESILKEIDTYIYIYI